VDLATTFLISFLSQLKSSIIGNSDLLKNIAPLFVCCWMWATRSLLAALFPIRRPLTTIGCLAVVGLKFFNSSSSFGA